MTEIKNNNDNYPGSLKKRPRESLTDQQQQQQKIDHNDVIIVY